MGEKKKKEMLVILRDRGVKENDCQNRKLKVLDEKLCITDWL